MPYERIPKASRAIRLLELLPAHEDDDTCEISCRLTTVSLATNEPYAALSYRWDRITDSETISINGNKKQVGKNLASALRHIRAMIFQPSSLLPSLIWVDALCINQDDEEEKSHQVQLMGAVYSNASTVLSWLGADEAGTMTAAITALKIVQHVAACVPDWLENLSWMKKYPSLLDVDKTGDISYNHVWWSVNTFFKEPYWGRVWVLQEMVLARRLWVVVGKHVLDYEAVVNFVQLLERFGPESKFGEGIIPFDILFRLKCQWIPIENHTIVKSFREHSKSGKTLGDAEKLEAIFSTMDYQATDPRDKVFALQGLLGNFIPPDYGMSKVELYSSLVARFVTVTTDLYILHYSGTAVYPPETVAQGLPSWVPDWQAISLMDRWQYLPAQVFCADHGMGAFRSFQAGILDERCLRVNAAICDTVLSVEPICNTESINFVRIYRKFLENRKDIERRTQATYLQALARVILAGSCSEGQYFQTGSDTFPAQKLFLATLYYLEGVISNAPIFQTLRSTAEGLGLGFEDDVSSLVRAAFPDGIIHDCWRVEKATVCSVRSHGQVLGPHFTRSSKEQHHVFRTCTGYVGSSRNGVQAGDVVGVIQGCPSPVLLRKEGAQYVHIGTCYVLGLMDGEAATQIRQGSLEISEIDIV